MVSWRRSFGWYALIKWSFPWWCNPICSSHVSRLLSSLPLFGFIPSLSLLFSRGSWGGQASAARRPGLRGFCSRPWFVFRLLAGQRTVKSHVQGVKQKGVNSSLCSRGGVASGFCGLYRLRLNNRSSLLQLLKENCNRHHPFYQAGLE